ncbi:MAG: hypothetical protein AAFS10_15015, partial [Myxococcota bacterium]
TIREPGPEPEPEPMPDVGPVPDTNTVDTGTPADVGSVDSATIESDTQTILVSGPRDDDCACELSRGRPQHTPWPALGWVMVLLSVLALRGWR